MSFLYKLVVLGELNYLVKEWISDFSESKNLPPSAAANVGAKCLHLVLTVLECTLKAVEDTCVPVVRFEFGTECI
ncbi:poly(A) polymerase gamma-like isoform X2 [Tyto alba]|uniref:poly(A) polymerase gamma-like isoform X2 n=1 Tax=Tyto alba TaxID=56313 RepID=UPI0014033119|nr:poly(A) polymerase gamma-like isoform X2 [Tyto alba]